MRGTAVGSMVATKGNIGLLIAIAYGIGEPFGGDTKLRQSLLDDEAPLAVGDQGDILDETPPVKGSTTALFASIRPWTASSERISAVSISGCAISHAGALLSCKGGGMLKRKSARLFRLNAVEV